MPEKVDYTEALSTVNNIHDGMSSLARSVVSALKDGDAVARNKILYVLEHGRFTLDET